MSSDMFYNHLVPRMESMNEILAHEEWFVKVPEDWVLFISDIVGSTQAVKDGRDKEVNMAAAGAIIAALNLAGKNGIQIPFVFGGDGAAILCPPSLSTLMGEIMAAHRNRCKEVFDLDIRMGAISVKELNTEKEKVSVIKKHTNDFFSIPVFRGKGINIAERMLKEDVSIHIKGEGLPELLDISGLECRWDVIEPPVAASEVVCLIMFPLAEEKEILRDTLDTIEKIYGNFEQRNPVHPSRLKLMLSARQLGKEARLKMGKGYFRHFLKIYTKTLLGKFYFNMGFRTEGIRAREYLEQLSVATDTLKIDGSMKTMFYGTVDQRIKLVDWLSEQENAGRLLYGYFATPSSIITCFVRKLNGDHFHFIDGYGGGYTRASYEVKTKWSNKEELRK